MTEKPTYQRWVSTIKHRSLNFVGTLTGSATAPASHNNLRFCQIKPLSVVTPLELDITYGLNDDPANGEDYQLYLTAYDEAAPPTPTRMRLNSWWGTAQAWVLSAGGYMAQTLEHQEVDFWNPKPYNTMEIFPRAAVHSLRIALADTGSVGHTIIVLPYLHYREDILQRTWKGRDEDPFDDYEYAFEG